MAKRGKKYRSLLESVDQSKLYGLSDALENVKKTSFSKFKGAVDGVKDELKDAEESIEKNNESDQETNN